jgi:hypothetical protein
LEQDLRLSLKSFAVALSASKFSCQLTDSEVRQPQTNPPLHNFHPLTSMDLSRKTVDAFERPECPTNFKGGNQQAVALVKQLANDMESAAAYIDALEQRNCALEQFLKDKTLSAHGYEKILTELLYTRRIEKLARRCFNTFKQGNNETEVLTCQYSLKKK